MPSDVIPIFPLAQVVLFPGVRCPLHIFEPRYRQMTEAALRGERRIGMVTVRPDEAHAMAGDPGVFEVGCEGAIADWKRLDDGRFDIVLEGTRRFRILDEPPRAGTRLYRVARVERLDDRLEPGEADALAALRARTLDRLETLVERYAGERPPDIPAWLPMDRATEENLRELGYIR